MHVYCKDQIEILSIILYRETVSHITVILFYLHFILYGMMILFVFVP